MTMTHMPKVRRRLVYMAAGYVLLVGFLQTNCTPPTDPVSHCPTPLKNSVAVALNLQPRHYEPQECPVRVKATQSPIKNFVLEIFDQGHHFLENDPVSTSFKSAVGQPISAPFINYFDGFSTNLPQGVSLSVRVSAFYNAGAAGFPANLAVPTDTAISTTILGTQTAIIWQPLPYSLEQTPAVTGPTSITWGDPAEFRVDGSYVRRGVTVRWRLDGQLIQVATIPVTGQYAYFSPGFSTAGSHKVSMISISALGRVDSVTRTIYVNAPAGCSTPPIPLRAAPDSLAASGGYHPLNPGTLPNTKCPPQ